MPTKKKTYTIKDHYRLNPVMVPLRISGKIVKLAVGGNITYYRTDKNGNEANEILKEATEKQYSELRKAGYMCFFKEEDNVQEEVHSTDIDQ